MINLEEYLKIVLILVFFLRLRCIQTYMHSFDLDSAISIHINTRMYEYFIYHPYSTRICMIDNRIDAVNDTAK